MFGLSFLSPLFLIGTAAAVIPIAIHLFFRRAEPVINFSAMRFLRASQVDHAHRQRLREILLLSLRVAAVALLAAAFARPYLGATAASAGPSTLVLVDTSASMSAPGTLERARTLAARTIENAPVGHAVGVATFGNSLALQAPLTNDRAASIAIATRLAAGSGTTRYQQTLAAAAGLLGNGGRLVVITDLQQSGWDSVDVSGVSNQVNVEILDVAAPAENLAVASLRVDAADVTAVIRNFSARVQEVPVTFSIDGKRIADISTTVPADGQTEARTSIAPGVTGALSASIPDRQGFAADNVRYALPGNLEAPEVVLVSASGQPSEAFYLERAIAVGDAKAGFRVRLLSGEAFSGLTRDALGNARAVVLLGTRGLERRGRELLAEYVEAGGAIWLVAGPDMDPQVIRGAMKTVVPISVPARSTRALHFAPEDSRHPVFQLFSGAGQGSLGNVSFSRAARIDAGAVAHVIGRYDDGTPALAEQEIGKGRLLLFASDLNNQWNNFPVEPAFVPFVHETLRYLTARKTTTSEYLVGDLTGQAGATPGIVSLEGGRRVAVNVDARESDPTRISQSDFLKRLTRLNTTAAQQAAVKSTEQESQQRLWQYAVGLMIICLAAEGLLGRRLA